MKRRLTDRAVKLGGAGGNVQQATRLMESNPATLLGLRSALMDSLLQE